MSDTKDEEYIGPEEETVKGDISPFFAPPDALIGTEVGGYLVKGRLGSGGMGIVYEGEQPVIGKKVAIKVLKSEVAGNPDVVKRLISEARAVNAVGHRNIIDVFGFAEIPDGRQAIIMELLEGESLEQLLAVYRAERRTMPLTEVLVVLDEMLSALASAHAAGVIHRDLKPSNVFLCRQRDGSRYVKILDFGIAKLGVLGDGAHNASVLVGTPAYMAPEQATGGVVSPALDLYAVGVMAFELLTGRLPFIANSLFELMTKHAQERPPLPSSIHLGLPDELDDLVMKLLEKKPEDRYASANAVRAEVLRLKKKLSVPTSLRGPDPSAPDVEIEDTLIKKTSPITLDAPPTPAPAPAPLPLAGEPVPPSARSESYSLADDDGTEDTLPRGARLKTPPSPARDEEDTLPKRQDDPAASTIDDGIEDTQPTAKRVSKALDPTAEVRRAPRPGEMEKKPVPAPRRKGLPTAVLVGVLLVLVALVAGGVLVLLGPR
jgi:serine/threonine-protein kinase